MAAFSAQDLRAIEPTSDVERNRVNPHASELNALAEAMTRHKGRRAVSPAILEGLVRLSEFAITIATGLIAYATTVLGDVGLAPLPLLAVPLLAMLVVLALQALGTFRLNAFRAPTRFSLRIALAWGGVFGPAFAACAMAHVEHAFTTGWLAHWALEGFVALAAERSVLCITTNRLARAGKLSRRTVIVGGGAPARQLLQDFAARDSDDLHILGIFDDRTDDRSPDVVGGFPSSAMSTTSSNSRATRGSISSSSHSRSPPSSVSW